MTGDPFLHLVGGRDWSVVYAGRVEPFALPTTAREAREFVARMNARTPQEKHRARRDAMIVSACAARAIAFPGQPPRTKPAVVVHTEPSPIRTTPRGAR